MSKFESCKKTALLPQSHKDHRVVFNHQVSVLCGLCDSVAKIIHLLQLCSVYRKKQPGRNVNRQSAGLGKLSSKVKPVA